MKIRPSRNGRGRYCLQNVTWDYISAAAVLKGVPPFFFGNIKIYLYRKSKAHTFVAATLHSRENDLN